MWREWWKGIDNSTVLILKTFCSFTGMWNIFVYYVWYYCQTAQLHRRFDPSNMIECTVDSMSVFSLYTDLLCCTNTDLFQQKFKQLLSGNRKTYRLQRGSKELDDFSTSSVVFTETAQKLTFWVKLPWYAVWI